MMEREQAREAAAVMLHYADGGEVEVAWLNELDWEKSDEPAFDFARFTYRIKRTLPEVGKWYEIPGAYVNPMKCIAHDEGLFVFRASFSFSWFPDTNDFSDFKQVEP